MSWWCVHMCACVCVHVQLHKKGLLSFRHVITFNMGNQARAYAQLCHDARRCHLVMQRIPLHVSWRVHDIVP